MDGKRAERELHKSLVTLRRRLDDILNKKNAVIYEEINKYKDDPSRTVQYGRVFTLKTKHDRTLIGQFECNSDTETSETILSATNRITRLGLKNISGESIEAIQISWIGIEPAFAGKGYGALWFARCMLQAIIDNPHIQYVFLSDCSEAAGKICNNLYKKFAFAEYTHLIEEASSHIDLTIYLENTIPRIEEENRVRLENPHAFSNLGSFSDDSHSHSAFSQSSTESDSNSGSDGEPERDMVTHAADTSVAVVSDAIKSIVMFVNKEKSKLLDQDRRRKQEEKKQANNRSTMLTKKRTRILLGTLP